MALKRWTLQSKPLRMGRPPSLQGSQCWHLAQQVTPRGCGWCMRPGCVTRFHPTSQKAVGSPAGPQQCHTRALCELPQGWHWLGASLHYPRVPGGGERSPGQVGAFFKGNFLSSAVKWYLFCSLCLCLFQQQDRLFFLVQSSNAVEDCTPNRCTTLILQLGLALVREAVLGLRNLTSHSCCSLSPAPHTGPTSPRETAENTRHVGTKRERWSLSPEQVPSILTSLTNMILEPPMIFRHDLYFDLGNGYTNINICQDPSGYALKIHALSCI